MKEPYLADFPPTGPKNRWTEKVLVETNLGRICAVSYFHGEEGGVWQRTSCFSKGEHVSFWIPMPEEFK